MSYALHSNKTGDVIILFQMQSSSVCCWMKRAKEEKSWYNLTYKMLVRIFFGNLDLVIKMWLSFSPGDLVILDFFFFLNIFLIILHFSKSTYYFSKTKSNHNK